MPGASTWQAWLQCHLLQQRANKTSGGLMADNKMNSCNTCCVDMSYLSCADETGDLDITARRRSKRKPRTPSSASPLKSTKPVQLSAIEIAKGAMTLQEPQLLEKMENVAYRLTTQADERKSRMNSRYCCLLLHVSSCIICISVLFPICTGLKTASVKVHQ